MKQSNIILALIFVALLAIFGFMVYEHEHEPSVGESLEEVSNAIDEATEN